MNLLIEVLLLPPHRKSGLLVNPHPILKVVSLFADNYLRYRAGLEVIIAKQYVGNSI